LLEFGNPRRDAADASRADGGARSATQGAGVAGRRGPRLALV
jgi:hypothetical protein